MSFRGAPVMLAGGAPDDRREWRCVGMMLAGSCWERDCERTRPQNVIPSRDRMTSSSSPTRWHHRRRSRSTLFHRIEGFCAILAPKVCCRSGGWDRKKGRSNRATHSITHKVSVDADLVSFDAALVDAGRREGAECAINILRSRMCSTFRCASLRGLRALFHRAAASIIGQSNGMGD